MGAWVEGTPRERRESLIFVLPLVVFVLVFIVIPVLGTVVNSCFRDVPFMERRFLGLENYGHLFTDSRFWQSFRFTLLFTAASVPLEMILGLLMALVLNYPMRFRMFLRAVLLIPWAIPAAVSARTWELIYNYHYGLANFLVSRAGLSSEPVNWLGSSGGAFFSLVISDAWKTTPFVAIILLAGMQAIPVELYRQAQIDRATFLQRFVKITLPLLKPVIVVALLFRTIDSLRVFDLIFVLTRGGPGGATNSLSLYGYSYFLLGDFGYGSAISVVLFCAAIGLSVIYVRMSGWGRAVT
jgi:multiple sugar transport system permease protein